MKQHSKFWFAAVALASLVACGGGGGASNSLGTPSLTGTVAVGAPLPEATVTLKDANGKTLTQTADANGAYSFSDVSGLTAPLMLQAKGTAGGVDYTLHSLLLTVPATGVSGVVNVTPATDAATAQATNAVPADVFGDPIKIKAIDATKLAEAKARLNAALADVLTALGKDANVDLFTAPFKADNTGLDKLLDLVSINNQDSSKGQADSRDITITDKATQVTRTLLSDDTLTYINSNKIPAPPSTTLALDTSGIKTSLAQFNALTGTADSIKSAAMKDLFDPNYLDAGLNRDAQIADIATYTVGLQLVNYVLNGCDGATKICQGQATAQVAGVTQTLRLPFKLGADGKWRAYGDQAPFSFDLNPVVYQQNYVGVNAPAPTVQTGFNFRFTGYIDSNPNSPRVYKSAQLYTSQDDGATWTLTTSVKENSSCSTLSYLPIDGAGCTSFKSVSNAITILQSNTAQAKGQQWFKIVAYPNADYTGTSVEYKARSSRQLFNSYTAGIAVKESGLGITTSELGTNSVSFVGNPYLVSISVIPAGQTVPTNFAKWDNATAIKTLNGKATVAAALAQCGNSCSSAYSTGAKISNLRLNGYDPQGRSIWMQYSQGSVATAAPSPTSPRSAP